MSHQVTIPTKVPKRVTGFNGVLAPLTEQYGARHLGSAASSFAKNGGLFAKIYNAEDDTGYVAPEKPQPKVMGFGASLS